MVGKDQGFGSGSRKGGAATQPVSRRLRLSAQALETAHLFSATRPAGTLDQSGRKRDPTYSAWSQELDPSRVRGSRSADCSDHLGDRNLPATPDPTARLL